MVALFGSLLFTAVERPAIGATATTDVIFSLDGSGSIDASDWQLQKDGYSAALRDAVAFPLDGSVAVGVNQWSGTGQVRTEVPLTVIDSQARVDSIISTIQGISQFQGATDPVTGLDNATGMLTASGRAGAEWAICMSSDGVKNSGGGSITGSAASAEAAGVDRYSVIGIEDFGNGAALAGFYGPAVFGGGTFTLARNTVEFANLIIGGCLNEPVELVGIEVNQGIQNWRNTVPLVAAKPAAVRAFVQVAAGTDPQRVSGRLIGRRGGAELPGSPLLATNAAGSVLAGTDIVARRAVLADSLNFLLPDTWRSGTVELEFEGAGTPVSCSDAAAPAGDDCMATVTFESGAAADIKVIGVPFTDGAATVVPPPAALFETGFRIRTALPASRMSIDVQDQLFTSLAGPEPDLAAVNSSLAKQRFLDLCFSLFGCDTLYYGQLNGNVQNGLANGIPADVASGWDLGLHARDAAGLFRNVAPHEVGHMLNLHHSVRGPVVDGGKQGPCGEGADSGAPDYPYFGPVGGRDRSLLNPSGAGDDDQNWGVDTRFVRNDVNNLAVIPPIGPNATFDLMGYCWINAPQDIWPSDHTWGLAKDGLDGRFGATVSRVAAAATNGEHLLFTGRIDRDTDTATIDSPALVTGQLPAPPAGDYELRMLDAAGNRLAAVPFDPQSDSSRRGPPDSTVVHRPDFMFVVPVLRPAAAVARVEVWHGSTQVGQLVASPGTPTVVTTELAGGSTQAGDTVHFAWTGSDPDGDPLTYHLRYSADGGTTWETFAVDFSGTSIDVPRSDLTGGTGAVFQVQASDGLNLSAVTSPPFAVEGSGPVVDLTSPLNGETFYSGVQRILLEATAQDNEDDDVSASIVWTSDVDGRIFTGPSGSIGANQLSEGIHLVTATATDADGDAGSTTVRIEVFRVAPPPGQVGPPQCTADRTGDIVGPLTVNPAEHLCLDQARVAGGIVVNPGGSLSITDSTVTGGVTAVGPMFVKLCKTQVGPPGLRVSAATGQVVVGDPGNGCEGNRLVGVALEANGGGVVLAGNEIVGDTSVNDNSRGPVLVAGNTIGRGSLACSGNNPPPTDAGQPNTASGGLRGQCAGGSTPSSTTSTSTTSTTSTPPTSSTTTSTAPPSMTTTTTATSTTTTTTAPSDQSARCAALRQALAGFPDSSASAILLASGCPPGG